VCGWRPAGAKAPPYANIPHYFLDMGGDSLLAFSFLLFFDPNGIRLEISSDLDGDEEDLQVIRSCSMTETELRAELETISSDEAWIDDMSARARLESRHGLDDTPVYDAGSTYLPNGGVVARANRFAQPDGA
jgi:hypothetical protein